MLRDLIKVLETADPARVLPVGFTNPHSYRGDYCDLAFEPARDVTVSAMLADARSADGATYEGWKGGQFEMYDMTDCWLSEEGVGSDETLGPTLLMLMLAVRAADMPEGWKL